MRSECRERSARPCLKSAAPTPTPASQSGGSPAPKRVSSKISRHVCHLSLWCSIGLTPTAEATNRVRMCPASVPVPTCGLSPLISFAAAACPQTSQFGGRAARFLLPRRAERAKDSAGCAWPPDGGRLFFGTDPQVCSLMQPHTAGLLCDSVEPRLTRCRAAGRLAASLLLLLSPPGKPHSPRLHHPNPSLPTADISQGKPGPVFLPLSLCIPRL